MNNIRLGELYCFIFAVTKLLGYNEWSWWYIFIGALIEHLFETDKEDE